MAKKDSRCWPGYEPVPGKEQHEQGSCRPKAGSKMSGSEKNFRGKRDEQLGKWKAEHPGSLKKAAQHLHAPGATTETAKKKSAAKKATKKVTANSPATKKKTTTKKRTTKKTAVKAVGR